MASHFPELVETSMSSKKAYLVTSEASDARGIARGEQVEDQVNALNMPTVDLWRDSIVRYLGYANEVGEAFRPLWPRFVLPSYAIASAYVIGDTIDKSFQAKLKYEEEEEDSQSNGNERIHLVRDPSSDPTPKKCSQHTLVFHAAVDTLLWQGLASVILPGIVINRVVSFPVLIALVYGESLLFMYLTSKING